MGNRAVITTEKNFENNGVGVYLHWNGGYDSVSAFLKYCEIKGYRTPDTDNYGWARLCQVVGNFFGGSTSVGIDTVDKLDCDNYDNGVYIIKGWEIVDRKHKRYSEQMEYEMEEMLLEIDNHMPKEEQIGEYLKAKEIPTEDLSLWKQKKTKKIMTITKRIMTKKIKGGVYNESFNGKTDAYSS